MITKRIIEGVEFCQKKLIQRITVAEPILPEHNRLRT